MAGGKAAAEARAVTAVAVRCSAWLGDSFIWKSIAELPFIAKAIRTGSARKKTLLDDGPRYADEGNEDDKKPPARFVSVVPTLD